MDVCITFIVQLIKFRVLKSQLLKYPDSVLTKLVLDSSSNEIVLPNSDPDIFKYIESYIHKGILFNHNKIPNIELSILKRILHEAEMYKLEDLDNECHNFMGMIIGKKLEKVAPKTSCDLIYDPQEEIIKSISQLYLPYCISGTLVHKTGLTKMKFYQDSTFDKPNIDALLKIAEPSPFGKGKETLIDPKVRKSMEINAEKLDLNALMCFEESVSMKELRIGRENQLTVKPYKLVIYQPGDHFLEHRDTVRAPNHVGTVTVILNTKFEGGAFCIKHGDKVDKYSDALSYVAMFGDCLHWIEPVTSGYRVSMIYDIFASNENFREIDETYKLNSGFYVHDFCAYTFPIKISPEAHYDPPSKFPSHLIPQIQNLLGPYNGVIIALHHMYPLIQIERNQLKGSDHILFEGLNNSILNDDVNYKVYLLPIVVGSEFLDGEMKSIEIKTIGNILDDSSNKKVVKVAVKKGNLDEVLTTNNNALILAEEFKYIIHNEDSEYNGNEGFLENFKYLMTAIIVTKLHSTTAAKKRKRNNN